MSHDQRPGRVRVVGNRPVATPTRDIAIARPEQTVVAQPAKHGRAASGQAPSRVLLYALFVAGCAVGAALLPLFHLI